MKLFFENITEQERVSMDFPLEAVFGQVLEVFEQLPEEDGSTFGLVTEENMVIQFSKYNQFMWLVEIPDTEKHGVYQSICNRNQCVRFIENLFLEKNPFDICEFKFHSYL
ncbi:MAG: hypothetical protein ACK5IC_06560 [Moheibacter sp.]